MQCHFPRIRNVCWVPVRAVSSPDSQLPLSNICSCTRPAASKGAQSVTIDGRKTSRMLPSIPVLFPTFSCQLWVHRGGPRPVSMFDACAMTLDIRPNHWLSEQTCTTYSSSQYSTVTICRMAMPYTSVLNGLSLLPTLLRCYSTIKINTEEAGLYPIDHVAHGLPWPRVAVSEFPLSLTSTTTTAALVVSYSLVF